MKAIVFDTSSVISIVTNDLLWVLPLLKDRFNGNFVISKDVKKELVDDAIKSRRFRLEGMQVLSFLSNKHIEVIDNKEISNLANYLMELSNNLFNAKGEWINIVHGAEVQSLALAKYLNATYVVDERTMRLLVENPLKLKWLLMDKLHTKVRINEKNLRLLKKGISNINIIRSTELMMIAYELGILDVYLNPDNKKIMNINLKRNLIEGLLWGLRLRGCSISTEEINEILRIKS